MVKKILGGLTIIVLIAIFVYKDLYTRVTVVGTSEDTDMASELETIEFFRAIASKNL